MPTCFDRRASVRSLLLSAWFLLLIGCGEPSARELKNRQEFEALLTAVALKNKAELDRDAKRIDNRHASGELADGSYDDLRSIIAKAHANDPGSRASGWATSTGW